MTKKKAKQPIKIDVVRARMTRAAGILAGRLAQLLSGSLLGVEAIAEGHGFLHAFFELVSGGKPLKSWSRNPLDRRPAGDPHPLDLLAEKLSLSPIEVELLLLAGLSEEHEGLAAILRTLHPRNEPRVSVGLAV